MNQTFSRRSFLRSTTTTAVATGFVPYFVTSSPTRAVASNDRFVIGCIGLGGMGTGDAHDHSRFGDIVAVCDVDSTHAERAKNDEKIGKGKADSYVDYRELLDRKDIDVVSIVTPDHWHTKIAIEALQAGKHVFCQKPLTLTLEENVAIRNAANKYSDKVFMIGTQQRSDRDLFLRAVNLCHQGLLGDIKKITCGIDGGAVGGPFAKQMPPANLDWNLWLGQAPLVDYIPERCHGNFRWWYEYSGGKFTDWGAHHIDIAIWAAKRNEKGMGPISIDGSDSNHPMAFVDGNPTEYSAFNTSHDFNIVHRFEDGLEIHVSSRVDNGLLIEGTKGRIFVNRGKISGKPIQENWDEGMLNPDTLKSLYKGKPFEGHKDNFYRCIREGGLPVSDVHSHLQTMSMCHLSVIAARLKRPIRWNPQQEQIESDEQAFGMMSRIQRPGFEFPSVA
jgi:predicted dehydrogenase